MAFSFSLPRYYSIFFVIMLFFIRHTVLTQASRPISTTSNTDFIKISCKIATFPDLCYNTLSTYASDIQRSPKLLANSALSVTINTMHTTLDVVSNMSKAHPEGIAIRDCLEVLGDAVEELKNSVTEMKHIKNDKKFKFMISDIQTWVSGALTNEDTCMQGFEEKDMGGKLKSVIRGRIVNVCHLTSNALALVKNYALLQC